MTRTLIVTDSCADLSYERLGDSVMVVPFIYHHESDGKELRDSTYIDDYLSVDDIHSAGVTYEDLFSRLEYAYQNKLNVIMLYSSGKINRCNEAVFLLVLEDFKRKYNISYKDMRITALDSGKISQALGILINNLVELEQKGYGYDQLINYIKSNKDLYELEFISDKKGKGLFNTGKRSIYRFDEGKVVKARKCNSDKLRLNDLVLRFINDADLSYPVSIVHNDNELLAHELYTNIASIAADLDVIDSTKVVSSLMGEKSVGLAYKKKVRK